MPVPAVMSASWSSQLRSADRLYAEPKSDDRHHENAGRPPNEQPQAEATVTAAPAQQHGAADKAGDEEHALSKQPNEHDIADVVAVRVVGAQHRDREGDRQQV